MSEARVNDPAEERGMDKRCSNCGRETSNAGRAAALTPIERTILGLMAQGYSDEAIAALVYRSKNTINWHVQRIKLKLNVGTRIETVVLAIRCGVI